MKVNYFCLVVLLTTLHGNLIESRGIRRKKLLDHTHDYEASGDYFEVTVSNFIQEAPIETTTRKATSSEEVSSDDGVTCSQSNITDILAGYELENHVLVLFKVNVSANERELVL
jgi:hypothetical protein